MGWFWEIAKQMKFYPLLGPSLNSIVKYLSYFFFLASIQSIAKSLEAFINAKAYLATLDRPS